MNNLGNDDRYTSRGIAREKVLVDPIVALVVRMGGEVDPRQDDMGQVRAGAPEDVLQIPDRLSRLLFDALCQMARLLIPTQLAGDPDKVSYADGIAPGTPSAEGAEQLGIHRNNRALCHRSSPRVSHGVARRGSHAALLQYRTT